MRHQEDNKKRQLMFRISIGIIVPTVVLLGLCYLYYFGNPLRCWVYETTGLYCTGCGSGRATYAILHGNVLKAIRHNVFFVAFIPIAVLYSIKVYVDVVFNKKILVKFQVSQRQLYGIILFTILYTVLRNIQIIPFIYLAP